MSPATHPVPEPVQVCGRVRPLPDALVRRVVHAVLRGERRPAEVSVTFLGRDAMRRLNASALGRGHPTDVIAFALPSPTGGVVGDIYLCPWMAARAARRYHVALRQELIRLVIHGTLHVLGWEHPADATRMRSPMWVRQESYVAKLA